MQITPTSFRALLYFGIAFLAPFSDKVLAALYESKWPTMQIVVASCLSGVISGLVALRAYYDGSSLRFAQEAGTAPPVTQTAVATDAKKPVVS